MHLELKEETSSKKLPQSQSKTTMEYSPGSETGTVSNSDEEGFITVSAPAPES